MWLTFTRESFFSIVNALSAATDIKFGAAVFMANFQVKKLHLLDKMKVKSRNKFAHNSIKSSFIVDACVGQICAITESTA